MIKYDFRKSTKCTYFETEGVQNKMCTGILGTPTYCMQSYTQDYGDLYKEKYSDLYKEKYREDSV